MLLNKTNDISIDIDFENELKNVTKQKQYTIPIFIPHMGCKNDCVFCNQRRISGKISVPTVENINKTIQDSLEYFKNTDKKVQIAFFGGSFTGLKASEQIMYLKTAFEYVQDGRVDSIRISTRPDYINTRVLKVLKKYKVENIELGVQSMDEEVLKASKRGHTSLDIIRATKLIKLYKFKLGFQIMIGLPKSNLEKECESTEKLIRLKADEFRIYPVYVIEPTELYDMYLRKEYIPLEFDDAVYRTYRILKILNSTKIKVIRIGLQSTAEITQNSKKIVGPVCDNFSEYAISRLLLDKLEDKITTSLKNYNNTNRIHVVINKNIPVSLVVGPKRSNIKCLEEKYKIKVNVESVDE